MRPGAEASNKRLAEEPVVHASPSKRRCPSPEHGSPQQLTLRHFSAASSELVFAASSAELRAHFGWDEAARFAAPRLQRHFHERLSPLMHKSCFSLRGPSCVKLSQATRCEVLVQGEWHALVQNCALSSPSALQIADVCVPAGSAIGLDASYLSSRASVRLRLEQAGTLMLVASEGCYLELEEADLEFWSEDAESAPWRYCIENALVQSLLCGAGLNPLYDRRLFARHPGLSARYVGPRASFFADTPRFMQLVRLRMYCAPGALVPLFYLGDDDTANSRALPVIVHRERDAEPCGDPVLRLTVHGHDGLAIADAALNHAERTLRLTMLYSEERRYGEPAHYHVYGQ